MPLGPRDPASLDAYFGVPLSLGSEYRLVFDHDDAQRAFLTTDASMWSFFEPVLQRRLAQLDAQTSMSEQINAALLELLPSGRSQIGDVAQALGASTRTLQRRLRGEGTTFQKVLDQTRAQLARHYLTRTQLTTAEVAFLVGFDDPNSFYPAFRSWTGMTPQAARAGAEPST